MDSFTIFSNKEKKEEALAKAKSREEEDKIKNWPDFKITIKGENGYEDWGACWWRQDKAGNWYQSCSKSKPKPEPTQEKPF